MTCLWYPQSARVFPDLPYIHTPLRLVPLGLIQFSSSSGWRLLAIHHFHAVRSWQHVVFTTIYFHLFMYYPTPPPPQSHWSTLDLHCVGGRPPYSIQFNTFTVFPGCSAATFLMPSVFWLSILIVSSCIKDSTLILVTYFTITLQSHSFEAGTYTF